MYAVRHLPLCGTGVIGNNYDFATGGTGVRGYTSSDNGYGVTGFQFGYSTFDNYLWESGGLFGGRNGVIGITKEPGGFAVIGLDLSTSTTSWTGEFRSESGNGVRISTPVGQTGLTIAGGSQKAVVATDDGARSLYSEESTEVWFTDYGFGQLVGGTAVIVLDPSFASDQ